MTRSYETLCLLTLEVVQTILAFSRVLDDMETSRLASLHEPNLSGTQLVAIVVIDKSPGNTSIKSRTTGISLILGSSTLAFIRALAAPKAFLDFGLDFAQSFPFHA
ncbi:hypothetical protein Tco_1011842 [Tanacetum coccineum]